jgi:diguanylate cyclase (GGDEF)-like protein
MFNIDSFVPFYFSATMGINLLCSAFLVASGIINRRPVFKALFVGCIVALVYQYATWQYHDAQTLESAIYWLHLQTSIVILALPLFYFIYVNWSRVELSRLWMGFFCLGSFVFLVIHLFSDYTLRFTGNVELVQYTLFSGETASRVAGTQGYATFAFQAYAICILIGLMHVVTTLIKRRQGIVASILIFTLIVQVTAAVMSSFVDAGKLNFILMGGLPFTILNFLACIAISASLESKTLSLRRQIDKRENLEAVLSSLATGVSSNTSDTFYIQMMQELEKICRASTAYLAILYEDTSEPYVETKAVVAKGKVMPSFSYKLKDLPAELVDYNNTIFIEKGVQKKFPSIAIFKQMNAQGYICCPMKNDEGGTEGCLVMFFKHSIKKDPMRDQIVNIFTSRAGAEIRRNRLEAKAVKMAYFDYQTQLPNLTKMHELIKEAHQSNELTGNQSALVVVDINKFAEVNRQFGFENAEAAIQKLGERLAEYSKDDDITIARSGGDEFTMLIHKTGNNAEGLVNIHWEAVNRLITKRIMLKDRSLNLSCCGGAVVFPKQVSKHIEVMRCAETALDQAKRDKANMLRMFDESILEEIDRKQKIEKLLEQAIKNKDELFAVYQPKVDHKGNLIGAEALARWINKELGFVSPVEFIDVAESAGLIDDFGYWMVDTVCAQINTWRDAGFEVPSRIAINFSSLQLVKADFVLNLVNAVKAHNINPAQIEIELTESGLLTNIEECIAKLNSLRDVGFTIALDDFGTGYSSLSYLKDLPLDVLKIDRSFVNDLDANSTSDLARSIIDIGHNMSLDIVAEGVEEKKQVSTLNKMGCEIFQGYYFAKPMSSEDFLAWANEAAAIE